MNNQTKKFQDKMIKVNALKGKQAEDKQRDIVPALIDSVAKRQEDRRQLEFLLNDRAQKELEIKRLKAQIAELTTPKVEAPKPVPTVDRGGFRSPLHLWRLKQIAETGTFVDPVTREEWLAAGLIEYYAPDEEEQCGVNVTKLIDPARYAQKSRINWNTSDLRPIDIAFNEFDLERLYNPEFNVFDREQLKERWSSLCSLSKPLTGLTLSKLLKVYAEQRGLTFVKNYQLHQ